jgi:hypothetical protein
MYVYVERENVGVLGHERRGQGDLLPLAHRQLLTPLNQRSSCVVALRQMLHERSGDACVGHALSKDE